MRIVLNNIFLKFKKLIGLEISLLADLAIGGSDNLSNRKLIDSEKYNLGTSEISFMYGGFDHHIKHSNFEYDQEKYQNILSLIHNYLDSTNLKILSEIELAMDKMRVITFYMELIEHFESHESFDEIKREKISVLARILMEKGRDREVVKLGMVLGYLFGGNELVGKYVAMLGMHSEFTFYSIPYINRYYQNWDELLYILIVDSSGWSKTFLLDRLTGFKKPEFLEWLINGGYKNEGLTNASAYALSLIFDFPKLLMKDSLTECEKDLILDSVIGLMEYPFSHNFGLMDNPEDILIPFVKNAERLSLNLDARYSEALELLKQKLPLKNGVFSTHSEEVRQALTDLVE
ncbi:hypothetical protein HBN50_03360 [Halobacteriovorax sp. GB3]|uniref:hypothetical protein n=1 Tax=Halobacteriovorax sp. GB3 TaxID=2719615 RepID=UPI0023618907|nr:hypothetical protein [Halobacteriovorax sp. GB3]MDD0852115.1 hypothetical protein [Halobacteriovorax sp. GB3]